METLTRSPHTTRNVILEMIVKISCAMGKGNGKSHASINMFQSAKACKREKTER